MKDVQHEKFHQLMAEVESLEEQISARAKSGADKAELTALREKLADARNRLAKVSDGCGTGHNPGL